MDNQDQLKAEAKSAIQNYVKALNPKATDIGIETVADYVVYMLEEDEMLFYDAEAWADELEEEEEEEEE